MFIGHFAPALMAAGNRRAPSLPILFVAAQFVDWVFFGLLVTGTERMRLVPGISAMNPMDLYDMPYTHSLLGSAVWALTFGAVLFAWRRDLATAAIGAAVVLSHWGLDLLVHVPDLTLYGRPPRLGLGLWNHPLLAMPLELGITAAALVVFARATGASRARVWGLAGLLFALQAVNWYGPQPDAVDLTLTLLGWFGYALATAAARWATAAGRGASVAPTSAQTIASAPPPTAGN